MAIFVGDTTNLQYGVDSRNHHQVFAGYLIMTGYFNLVAMSHAELFYGIAHRLRTVTSTRALLILGRELRHQNVVRP